MNVGTCRICRMVGKSVVSEYWCEEHGPMCPSHAQGMCVFCGEPLKTKRESAYCHALQAVDGAWVLGYGNTPAQAKDDAWSLWEEHTGGAGVSPLRVGKGAGANFGDATMAATGRVKA